MNRSARSTNTSASRPTVVVDSAEEWACFDGLPQIIKDYLRDACFNWDSIATSDLLRCRLLSQRGLESAQDTARSIVRTLQRHEREILAHEGAVALQVLAGPKKIGARGGDEPRAPSSLSRAPSSKGSDGASKSKRRTR